MFRRILVPLDGSELAEKALPYAKTLAQKYEAELLLLRILPPLIPAPDPLKTTSQASEILQMFEDQARQYVGQWQTKLEDEQIQTQVEVLEGNPVAEMILEQSCDRNVDLIVMSTHGRSGNNRWAYGSVAQKVLQGAACPIFLVRTNVVDCE